MARGCKNSKWEGVLRQCPQCGREFQPKEIRNIYCSDKCRDKEIRQRRLEQYHMNRHGSKPCRVCGKMFEPTRSTQIYCGKECSRKAAKENEKEYQRQLREQKKEKPKKKVLSLAEINALAREKGMNYGEYVSRYL